MFVPHCGYVSNREFIEHRRSAHAVLGAGIDIVETFADWPLLLGRSAFTNLTCCSSAHWGSQHQASIILRDNKDSHIPGQRHSLTLRFCRQAGGSDRVHQHQYRNFQRTTIERLALSDRYDVRTAIIFEVGAMVTTGCLQALVCVSALRWEHILLT